MHPPPPAPPPPLQKSTLHNYAENIPVLVSTVHNARCVVGGGCKVSCHHLLDPHAQC